MTQSSYWPPDPASSPIPNAVAFHLLTAVNLPQLNAELSTALDTEVHTALVGPYDDGASVLWLTPPGIDLDQVASVVDAHQPDPDWGVPAVLRAYEAVLAKLAADPDSDLSADEVKSLAVGNALRPYFPAQ